MIHLVIPGEVSQQLQRMAKAAVGSNLVKIIKTANNLPNLQNKQILFAVEIDEVGFNIPLLHIFQELSKRGKHALLGSQGALLVHSAGELYTKSTAASVIFLANQLGCSFMGHPVVEATGSLHNLLTWQKTYQLPLEQISLDLSKRLGKRLMEDHRIQISNPQIAVLHSSYRKSSNTLMLWDMIKKHLSHCHIEELHVQNGTVLDCIGCPYHTCRHFGLQDSCFYGGFMVKEVLPTVENANAVVWICPNYNDSISANLMAVINRLTALYHKIKFYDKSLFAAIVSGNSGSDSLAKQLIDALNINKGFRLPPYFAIMATANDPGSILAVEGIEKDTEHFAYHILEEIKISVSTNL
ncbi:flavodoxin family protein [Geosporobacter ferrireducens]|uniref:FMN reductase n=1 Tax=Geosporobacter ferrireducens TaxID=1424294 RepID=A0A1D8GEB6_9FIRM|nr:NAD(P)H-dependent oxidoreductase [Geosporobacter ferrireducens]AOT69251.1 FMN reductase [Geosporobacter ferrireducens]MTI56933.1 NAD(P)H-dependent oxidoreductase [Geosporobacter ferrireducens]